jgi:DNA-binding MarR family transcriptional regulator
MPNNRNALVRQVMGAVRDWASASVAFQTALADARGLSFVEARTLDLLERSGPLTAGELSTRSRLAPASVTGLVDRLVRKGAVRRSPHPEDGRRVLIETIASGTVAGNSEYCRDLNLMISDLCAQYTNEQLAVIASFATAAAKRGAEATTRLVPPPARTSTPRT